MFHLAWFVKGFALQSWNETWSGVGATEWTMPDLYTDLARSLERACFDGMVIEDTSMVPDAWGGSTEYYLRNAHVAPKHDPVPLIPLIGAATRHLGIAATISTSFYPPFLLARMMATLDHLTEGRVGCNLVTSSSDRAAQNYGLDQLPPHDLRYEIAEEWMAVVNGLWSSWEPDAVVMDAERGFYADHTKVHPIDFAGAHHRCRGPLNTIPSPQGRPVIVQAGGSPAGRDFGARHADMIMAEAQHPQAMRAYREDLHVRLRAAERPVESCKIFYMTDIIVGETDAEAQDRATRHRAGWVQRKLVGMATATGIDFSRFDLDAPLPEISTEGIQSGLAAFAKAGKGKTLREIASATTRFELVGTPDGIAAQMEDIMKEVGGDGFLVINPVTRRTVSEITDGLAPALQKRRLIRPAYRTARFRDTLLEF
jgi:FMN-dependent oxidoreductase (nitrilotriacetate monooxygenase family)